MKEIAEDGLKHGKWIPHDLTEANHKTRVDISP